MICQLQTAKPRRTVDHHQPVEKYRGEREERSSPAFPAAIRYQVVPPASERWRAMLVFIRGRVPSCEGRGVQRFAKTRRALNGGNAFYMSTTIGKTSTKPEPAYLGKTLVRGSTKDVCPASFSSRPEVLHVPGMRFSVGAPQTPESSFLPLHHACAGWRADFCLDLFLNT